MVIVVLMCANSISQNITWTAINKSLFLNSRFHVFMFCMLVIYVASLLDTHCPPCPHLIYMIVAQMLKQKTEFCEHCNIRPERFVRNMWFVTSVDQQ